MDSRIFEVDPNRVRQLWETDKERLQEELAQAVISVCLPQFEEIEQAQPDTEKIVTRLGALLVLGKRAYELLYTPSPFSGAKPEFGAEIAVRVLSPMGIVIESYLSKATNIVMGAFRGLHDTQQVSAALRALEPFTPMIEDAFADDEFLQNYCELIVLGYSADLHLEDLGKLDGGFDPTLRQAFGFRFNASQDIVEFWDTLSAAFLRAKTRGNLVQSTTLKVRNAQQWTPRLTREQHAQVLGYESGRSAARTELHP